jgi:hypothetical protein
MKTKVTNLLTQESEIFINDLSLTENIVNSIICNIKKSTGNILNKDYRDKIKDEAKIKESVSTITGSLFAYSETFDLHAKFVK